MVKNFIVDSHRRQPPPTQASIEHDEGLEAELERPSYIDLERHAVQAADEIEKRDETKYPSRLVDVGFRAY
jgi:hypothetical protein